MAGFFREDAAGIPGFLGAQDTPGEVLSFEKDSKLPYLPGTKSAPEAEKKAYWRTLRAFFRSAKGGGVPLQGRSPLSCPALLAPFRDREYVQYNFPCWAADATSATAEEGLETGFYVLQDLLKDALKKIAPQEGQARILKDNLLRLEAAIREKVRFADASFKAAPVFDEALQELETSLAIGGSEGKSFAQDLRRLKEALPRSGVLIPFSAHAPLYLLEAAIGRQLAISRKAVREEINRLSSQLKDILAVEREKSPESHSAEHLHSALDFAGTFLNFEELSSVLPSGGSEAMPEERHHRLEVVLDSLQQADELLFGRDGFIVCDGGQPSCQEVEWEKEFPRFDIRGADSGRLSATAAAVFDEEMEKAAQLFAAMRIGQLEVNGQYVPEMHSDFFAHFDWRSFNEKELAASAPVILLCRAENLLEKELNAFSRQLASGRPINYLAIKSRWGEEQALLDENLAFRRELGALAIAHRNAFVLQSSAIRPEYLNEGFTRGIIASSPALFYLPPLGTGEDGLAVEPSLWASAAVEGRAFPAYTFDSQKGPKWGSRFDIRENPQPETDWPVHRFSIQNEKGEEDAIELPFTFADFAVLDSHFNSYFHIVPPEYWADGLIPLAEYLELSGEEVYSKVPYIWLVDRTGELQRAAVAWPLVLACQERLDFWHYLQENSGVHSYHVEQATDRLREEMQLAAEDKLAAVQASHKAELEKTREESARNAMERLASVLLDLDVDAVLPASRKPAKTEAPKPETSTGPAKPAPQPQAKEEPAPAEEKKEEPAEEELGEAWIETPLCTSCNECIDTNKNIFQYNADKQAIVANPGGGPFADIVRAAEKCPVRIIHPGAPQNPKEEGLEEWVKRAEPYQG